MTAEELRDAGIPIDPEDELAMLKAESAIEYISNNTTLTADITDPATIKALPAQAKLFIVKYSALMEAETGVASESLGGMSQSFDTSNRNGLLFDLAESLLGPYMKSQMKFTQATKRW